MNINVYTQYKVKIVCESSTLSEDCETIYDDIRHNEKSEEEMIITGTKLIQLIANELQEYYISEFTISDKKLYFEVFDYNTGDSESISYYIEEYTEKDI